MNILIYSRWPTEFTGGVERFVVSLRDAMRARGHGCDVVCAAELGCEKNATVRNVAAAMAQHWEQHKSIYDIALFNGEYGYKARGGRTVNVFHGTSRGQITADWRLRRLRSNIAEFILAGRQGRAARRHHPVAVSRSAARQLLWLYGVLGASVIENAIDVEHFSPGSKQYARNRLGLPAEGRFYLYASRVEPRKCPWFVPEWAQLFQPDEHLLVATDKPLVDESLAASGRVTALLNVPAEKMPLLYQAADVFFMPSYYEGCAYAVIEAMSCGCLLVASPVGHAPDIIRADPLLGECFERRRTAQAFLARARQLLDNPTLANLLQEHERKYVLANNTLEKMGEKYEKLFFELLQPGNRRKEQR